MSGPESLGGPRAVRATPPIDAHAQVRKLAHALEGVFLNQLFQAMRASVPEGGAIGSAPGQELFTQMLDERVASLAADRQSRGLGEALYRQLAARLRATDSTEAK